MDDKAGGVHCSQDSLSIYEHLDGGLLRAEEAEGDLVKTGGNGQDDTLVLVPKEVLRTRVDTLDLPRNGVTIGTELSRLPDPSCCTIFLTKYLIKLLLRV